MRQNNHRQSGAVAIFIVIFTSLTLLILTTGYMTLMVREQTQSNRTDISQSAYDSALVGVEDAKRVLAECRKDATGNTSLACQAIERKECNTVQFSRLLGPLANDEVKIQSSYGNANSGEQLDQAYTCVKIDRNTKDYQAHMAEDGALMVPLRGREQVSKIRVSWFRRDERDTTSKLGRPQSFNPDSLPSKDKWADTTAGTKTPPILQAQLIAPENGTVFNPAALKTSESNELVMLYPQGQYGGAATASFNQRISDDAVGTNNTQPVGCIKREYEDNGDYACRATIDLASLHKTIEANAPLAFLRLSSIYATDKTAVKVELLDAGDSVVEFADVQPNIDVTARTNNVFRRLETRVSYGESGDSISPSGAVETAGSICKDYTVTAAGVDDRGTCAKSYVK